VMRDLKQLPGFLIGEVMQDSKGKHEIKFLLVFGQRKMTYSLANKLCLRKACASHLDVVRTQIKSQVLDSRQVADNSTRTATDLKNASSKLWPNVLAHQYF